MRSRILQTGFLLFMLLASGCLDSLTAVEQYQIFYTASMHGEIEPCGWRSRPLGGLARKATVIKDHCQASRNCLILDAGDAFFKNPQVARSDAVQRKTAEFMIAVLDELGYMAYNVGGNDLAFGLEWVQSLANKAQVPFLSANILDSDGDLAFRPYIEEKVGRRKFGIVGISSVPNYELTGGSVGDPIEALKKYVIEIRDKVDFIIVLAAVSDAEETQILQTGLPVDLILRAATYRFSHSIITENDMMVSRLGNIGKYLGRIQITIHDPRQPIADASKLRSQLEYVGKRLSSFSKHIGNQSLEEYYKDRPNIVNIVRSLQEHQVKLEKELREIVNPVDFELIALDKNIADDPEMRRLIDEHKEKYNIQAPQ